MEQKTTKDIKMQNIYSEQKHNHQNCAKGYKKNPHIRSKTQTGAEVTLRTGCSSSELPNELCNQLANTCQMKT